MASLLLYAGALTYDKVQKSRQKKRDARSNVNNIRYSELEKDHAAHLARTQSAQQREICFCAQEQWDGRTHREGCPRAQRQTSMPMDDGRRSADIVWRGNNEAPYEMIDVSRELDDGPPSYEISEKAEKGKRGLFGGRRRHELVVR